MNLICFHFATIHTLNIYTNCLWIVFFFCVLLRFFSPHISPTQFNKNNLFFVATHTYRYFSIVWLFMCVSVDSIGKLWKRNAYQTDNKGLPYIHSNGFVFISKYICQHQSIYHNVQNREMHSSNFANHKMVCCVCVFDKMVAFIWSI